MSQPIRWRGPIVLATDIWDDAEIVIEDGKIAEINGTPFHARYQYRVQDRLIAPGLIDTHIHGSRGDDAMDADEAGFRRWARYLASQGTTGFLPTTMSGPHSALTAALATAAQVMKRPERGEAAVLGVHMEGPYLSPRQCGAQNPEFLRDPDGEEMRQYLQIAPVRIVTVAPERPGYPELAGILRDHGVVASLGHTAASFADAVRWLATGEISHVTHLFNGMPPLHHRDPGPAGAALFSSSVWCELICDGIHVHPEWVRTVHRLVGERVVLVTDAMRAAGLADGTYDLGGQPITVRGGVARTGNGSLAGSTLTLITAVRRFQAFTGCDWPTAFRAASLAPAAVLGIDRQKGSIQVGKDADLMIWDPVSGQVERTLVAGQTAWEAEEA